MAGARPSRFKAELTEAVAEVVAVVGRHWSEQQLAIFDWFSQKWNGAASGSLLDSRDFTNPNLVVVARAGTGKTTTIVEGVNRAPEDLILVCAFNKKIADVLNEKCTKAEAKTLHGLGWGYVRRMWPGLSVAKYGGALRSQYLTDQATVKRGGNTLRAKGTPRQVHKVITDLHTKVREMDVDLTFEDVLQTSEFFGLTVEGFEYMGFDQAFVVEAAISAAQHAATVAPRVDIGVDYADMVSLPLTWNLVTPDYQLVVVDEGQDMNKAQLKLARKACSGRMCIVGDNKQAIYGFRGADSGSLARLKKELGAVELGLNTTYRCGQVIVDLAQRLVPDIEAAPTNPEGIIDLLKYKDLAGEVQVGDFILSRINAPLVSITLMLIREGKRARMAGRDIGGAVKSIIEKLCKGNLYLSVEDMLERLNAWETKTVTKYANAGKLDLVDKTRDQAETIRALAEDGEESAVKSLIDKLAWLFEKEDDMDPSTTIICSSVHKAKGLEADRVFLLQESFYRRPGSELDSEEKNIEYVAITRAKTHLTWVYEVPGLTRRGQR